MIHQRSNSGSEILSPEKMPSLDAHGVFDRHRGVLNLIVAQKLLLMRGGGAPQNPPKRSNGETLFQPLPIVYKSLLNILLFVGVFVFVSIL
jgi:hypothetical protein